MLNSAFSTVGSRPLGLARVLIGGAAFVRAWIAFDEMVALGNDSIMKAPYFDWTPPPSLPLAIAVVVVWSASALLFAAGWRVPVTGSALVVSIAVVLALDEQLYGNHLYLMGWLVLLLTIAEAGAGLNWRRVDRPVVRWPLLLLMGQLSIVYGFSAITKLNESFLSGTVLGGFMGTGIVPFPESLRTPGFMAPLAVLAVFVELFVAIFIWRDRLRPLAFLLGFGLHLSIVLFLTDTLKVSLFALEMLALYPLFLPDGPIRVSWDGSSSRESKLVRGFRRWDLLRALELDDSGASVLTVTTPTGAKLEGFAAVVAAWERLVPSLWIADLARIPGFRELGRRWFARSRHNEGSPSSGR